MKEELWAVIAAAGLSTRMGQDKALVPFRGKSLLMHSLNTLAQCGVTNIHLTLPARLMIHHEVRQARLTAHFTTHLNQFNNLGLMGSVRTVTQKAHTNVRGLMVIPVDSPVLHHRLLHLMIKSFMAITTPVIMVPSFWGADGHPLIMSRHFFGDVAAISTLQLLIGQKHASVRRIFWPTRSILLNLNYRHELVNAEGI